jgi:tetratricopeptide (TPR) repeat protein
MANLDANEVIDRALQAAERVLMDKTLHAEIILKQLLKCDARNEKALQLMSIVKQKTGEYKESLEYCKQATDLDPNNADNYNNMALCYAGLDDLEKAIECMNKALSLSPDNHVFMNNLALQCRATGKRDKAIELFTTAAAISNLPQPWANLGGVYAEAKDFKNAERCFRRAVEINPTFLGAHVDLAFCYHLQGKWKEGFVEYEHRFDYFELLAFYKKAYNQGKRWDGKESLEGKRILLYGEQGLGDQIQFVRYCKYLKERGAYVMVHCSELLQGMFQRLPWVDEAVVRDILSGKETEPFPQYDLQCSLMSLPHLLDLDFIPKFNYIEAPGKVKVGSGDYASTFNVGVCWAGSAAHPFDSGRSVYAKLFETFMDVPNVKMFNFQICPTKRMKLHGKEIVDYTDGVTRLSLVDMTPMIKTFDDSAAIISDLDLIITVDTALVHLAGAMDVPCWTLIPFNCDWRWGAEGDTTPWYDSVRLFRQERLGDWEHVFERVKKELASAVLQNQRLKLSQVEAARNG